MLFYYFLQMFSDLRGIPVLGKRFNSEHFAIAAALLANVIWGFSFLASRVALGHTAPSMLLCVRFILSFLIMLLLAVIGAGKLDLRGKPIGLFILMGLCEPVIYFIAETNGIKYTTASFSGLMISLIPIATALLSVVILKEHLTARRFAWILCSVAGVIIISINQTSEGIVRPLGIVCLLIAILSAGFYTIISRKISGTFTPFERTFIMMLLGFIVFTSHAVIDAGAGFAGAFLDAVTDRYVILPVIFLSVICSVVAFFSMNFSMTYLDASRVTSFSNIIPVVSVLAGVLLLGEPFSFVYVIGIIMILVGVIMVNKVS